MSATLECPRCGHINSADESFCEDCQSWLPPVGAFVAPPAVAPPPVPHPPMAPAGPAVPDGGWVCQCGARLSASDPFCPDDGNPRPEAPQPTPYAAPEGDGGLRVSLPDGRSVTVRPGQRLELGRESGDPTVKASLAGYDGVSRRHATLSVDSGLVTVTDLNSLNGTSVDERPVDGSITLPIDRLGSIWLGRRAVLECTAV